MLCEEGVLPRVADERVAVGLAREEVVALAASQRILPGAGADAVASNPEVDRVGARAGGHRVVAVPAVDRVRAVAAEDQIVARPGIHLVRRGRGREAAAAKLLGAEEVVTATAVDGVVATLAPDVVVVVAGGDRIVPVAPTYEEGELAARDEAVASVVEYDGYEVVGLGGAGGVRAVGDAGRNGVHSRT